MHSQCDARPTVTFAAVGHHYPMTGTKLYCLVTEACVCEQLAQRCCLEAVWPVVELQGLHPNQYSTQATLITII